MPFSVTRLLLLRDVGDLGSVKAAAAATCVSASAVSQQLSILEQETGLSLLERHGRGVKLTTAGWHLARHAAAIADAISSAEAEVERMRPEMLGELRIAAFPTAARAVMPRVMTTLSQRHPMLKISLRDHESAEAAQDLASDAIDLAVIDVYDGSEPLPATLASQVLFRDPILVALPAGYPAPVRVNLMDLASEDWVMDSEGSPFHQATLLACRRSGFKPRIRSQCKDFGVILALVEARIGVALVPGLATRRLSAAVTLRPTNPPINRTVLATWRRARQRHPAIATAVSALVESAADFEGREA